MEMIRLMSANDAPADLQLTVKAVLAVKGAEVYTYKVRDSVALHVKFGDGDKLTHFDPDYCVTHALRLLDHARHDGLRDVHGYIPMIVMHVESMHIGVRISYRNTFSGAWARMFDSRGVCTGTNTNACIASAITQAFAAHYDQTAQA